MKKAIALFLLLSVIFPYVCMPVSATTIGNIQTTDFVTVTDDTGEIMQFQLVSNADGTFSLKYYLNGTLTTVYEMSPDSDSIHAVFVDGSQTYDLSKGSANCTRDQSIEQLALDIEPLYSDLGQINYNYSYVYECSPYAILTYRVTDQWDDTYYVNTYLESDYPDIIATIVGIIIGLNIPSLVGGSIVTNIAVAIVEAMLAKQGAEVVNQVINMLFIDSYSCEITTYSIIAAVIADGITPTTTRYDDGTKCEIYYSNLYSEVEYTGLTAENWAQEAFGERIWDDCISIWKVCPGVNSYQLEIDYPWE